MCPPRMSANELRIQLFPSRSVIEEVRNSQYFVCIVWHLDADHLGTNVKHVLNTFPCSIQFSVCIDDSPLSLIYAHYKPSHFCCKISQKTFYLWKEKNYTCLLPTKTGMNLLSLSNDSLCLSFSLGLFVSLVSVHLYRFCKFLNWLFSPCLGSGANWKPRKTLFWRIEHTKATVACISLPGLKIQCYQIRAVLYYVE